MFGYLVRVAFALALICQFAWPRVFFFSAGGLGVSPFTLSALMMLMLAPLYVMASPLMRARFFTAVGSNWVGILLFLLFWFWRFSCDYFGVTTGASIKADVLELLYLGSWFFIGLIMFVDDASIRALERALILTVLVATAVAVVEYETQRTIYSILGLEGMMAGDSYMNANAAAMTTRGGDVRVRSLFSHSIVFGAMMSSTIPLALHYIRHRGFGGMLLGVILLLCIAFCNVAANARTSVLVAIVVIGVYGMIYLVNLKTYRGYFLAASILLLAPLSLPVVYSYMSSVSEGRTGDEIASTAARRIQSNKAFAAVATRPITGFGTGLAIQVAGIQPPGRLFKTIDDFFLNIIVDYGYIGLALFVVMLMSFVASGLQAVALSVFSIDRSMLSAMVAMICGFCAAFFAASINDSLSMIFLAAGFLMARRGVYRWERRQEAFAEVEPFEIVIPVRRGGRGFVPAGNLRPSSKIASAGGTVPAGNES
ncbi:O-antigen ligase family protein [Novosphingobium rosa]|uniref:O-antigen ligase family protein n=1 Tax=Novosphingobium rosa TaxID=76978 RepID=UPI00082E05F9|nr:O-antigen ligase family protein [Novosphingobium rosa]